MTERKNSKTWPAVTAGVWLLGPCLALLAVWLPLILEYRVPQQDLREGAVEAMRLSPQAATFAGLNAMDWALTRSSERDFLVRRAEDALAGRFTFPGLEPIAFSGHPDPGLLTHPVGRVQLLAAAMRVPDDLLNAYLASGERRFFLAARDATLDWARYDARRLLPIGLLWNDHAIAARMVYLAKFWSVYRNEPGFDATAAAELLDFVYRSAARLARSSQYTSRSNHGIMQNLGLLHAAIAFPALPERDRFLAIARERLKLHVPYYVSGRGMVLEHSASYQEFGVELLDSLLRYYQLLDEPPPAAWRRRSERALCVLARMLRPDASLPFYGDSHGEPVMPAMPRRIAAARNRGCGQPGELWLEPAHGYALLNSVAESRRTQLFVNWADFPGRVHKHADELAVLIWSDGQDWWAGSGYWPYSDPAREVAVGWRGANAPHFRGAAPDEARESRLRAMAHQGDWLVLDLQRESADGVVRRQLLQLGAMGWLVLDSIAAAADPERPVDVVWSVAPGVSAVETGHAGVHVLQATDSPTRLDVRFLGPGRVAGPLEGRRRPFGGLTALPDGRIVSGEHWTVAIRPGEWAASLWLAGPAAGPTGVGAAALDWVAADRWRLEVPLAAGDLTVSRDGRRLLIDAPAGTPTQLELVDGPTDAVAAAAAVASYDEARARFPRFRDLEAYRWRTTGVIAGLWAGHGLLLVLLRRDRRRLRLALTLAAAVAWSGLAGWLQFVYLV